MVSLYATFIVKQFMKLSIKKVIILPFPPCKISKLKEQQICFLGKKNMFL